MPKIMTHDTHFEVPSTFFRPRYKELQEACVAEDKGFVFTTHGYPRFLLLFTKQPLHFRATKQFAEIIRQLWNMVAPNPIDTDREIKSIGADTLRRNLGEFMEELATDPAPFVFSRYEQPIGALFPLRGGNTDSTIRTLHKAWFSLYDDWKS